MYWTFSYFFTLKTKFSVSFSFYDSRGLYLNQTPLTFSFLMCWFLFSKSNFSWFISSVWWFLSLHQIQLIFLPCFTISLPKSNFIQFLQFHPYSNMTQNSSRRILTFPAVHPSEDVSPAVLLQAVINICRIISTYSSKSFPSHNRIAREAIREIDQVSYWDNEYA